MASHARFERADWNKLAQNRVQRKAPGIKIMNLKVADIS
jgi:hypothetical protein